MTVTLNPKITQAGLAIAPSASNPGIQVVLTHVALGTGRFVPNGSEVGLRAEVARYAITSGTNPSPRTVQVGLTITDLDLTGRTPNGKGIGEVGFYAGNTLFAVWSQDAEPLFYKSAAFDIPMAYTMDISALPANAVTVTVDASKAGLESLILAHEAKADPHPQYLTPAEGNAAYTPLAHAGAADPHPQYILHTEGDGLYTPIAHAGAADPHTQYLTTPKGDARYTPLAHASAGDPHPQYVTHTEGDSAYAHRGHIFEGDPHPQYLTPAEGNAAYTPLAHAGAANPHPQYMQRSDTNAAYVKQGGGAGQQGNQVYLGWSGGGLKAQVDAYDMGHLATEVWVNNLLTNLLNAAPSTLDQIGELARAIGSDPNFAVTMANQLAGKERKFDAGVRLACASWAAPVGWTTVNDDSTNNRMMRVVHGNGSQTGGIHDPTINNVVPPHTHSFSTGVESHGHSHGVVDNGHVHGGGAMVGDLSWGIAGSAYLEEGRGQPDIPRQYMAAAYSNISIGGRDTQHYHSGSTDNGSSQANWLPRYLNLIIIQKD
ncbi:MAG: hypothetical protein WKG03_00750 [Telluria sp.]